MDEKRLGRDDPNQIIARPRPAGGPEKVQEVPVVEMEPESKVWYRSSTLQLNGLIFILSLLVIIAQSFGLVEISSILDAIFAMLGQEPLKLDPAIGVGVIAAINIILRLTTKKPVSLTNG